MVKRLKLTRKSDWQTALSEYISAVREEGLPFSYGQNDCCTFAAGAVEAITGEDPIPEFRGEYESEIGSLKALKKIGAGSLEETLGAKFEEVDLPHVQRGDIVFFEGNCGVASGKHAWFVGDKGLDRLPISECSKAWKVG